MLGQSAVSAMQHARGDYDDKSRAAADGASNTRKATQVVNHTMIAAFLARLCQRALLITKKCRLESGDIPLSSTHSSVSAHSTPQRPSTAFSANHAAASGSNSKLDASAGSSDADVEKYTSEYRILSVRQRVLSNELQDIHGQITQVVGDLHSSSSDLSL